MDHFFSKNNKVIWLFFIFWGLLMYANSLEVPFYFDDLNNIEQDEHIHLDEISLKNILAAGFKSHIPQRPVSNISLAMNYYVNQLYVEGYHLFNIIIHIINGILLFIFLRLTLNAPALKDKYQQTDLLALGASLLWFSHPLNTQSVTYIVQRMNSMAALFFLAAFILYIKGRRQTAKKLTFLFFLGSILAWVLALGSKEISATLPFFIFMYEWYFFQDLNLRWLRRSIPYILLAGILLGGMIVLYLGTNPLQVILNSYIHRDFTLIERLLTQFRVVIHYISLSIYPHPSRLTLDYDFPLSFSLLNPPSTLFAIIAIIVFLVSAALLARKHRLLSFCILWFLGNLIIESSFIALEIIYEHRTYLPFMMFLMIPVLGIRFVFQQRIATVLLGCLILLFGWWTIERNNVWRDPVIFWQDCITKSPANPRPYSELGIFYGKHNRYDKAKYYFQKSLLVDPNFADAHNNLGVLLDMEGKVEEATAHFTEAVREKPYKAAAQYNLGQALFKQQKMADSIPHLERAAKLDPENVAIKFCLGATYLSLEKYEAAEQIYKEILQLFPESGSARAHLNQAVAQEKLGNGDY